MWHVLQQRASQQSTHCPIPARRPAPEPERAAAYPGASLPMTEGRALFISVSFTQLLLRAAHRSPNLHEYLALYQG